MNIAIFTDTYPPFINGVSTSCYNLAKVLKAHGHHVLVVAPRTTSGKFEFKDDILWLPGFELKKMYGYRITNIYSRKVIKILKEHKIEIIHNQTDIGVGQFAKLAAKALKIPIVYTYHTAYEDYTYYVTKGIMDRLAKKTIRTYSKIVAKNVTEFITPSIKTKDYMRSVGSDIYINVVPTGIDFALFSESNIDKEKEIEFKKKHNISEDTKILLLLGRIAKEKSMDFSIEGFAKYLKKNNFPNTKMIVVGDGPQREELELLVDSLGIKEYVIFIGKVPAKEVGFYYHLADIYTSASLTETQGLTFMEAMASGTIVLARFDANLAETISDGETGYFFTSLDGYVEKIEKILALDEEDKKLITEAASKTVDLYSFERFYFNIIGVYNRALKKYW